jgi:hypothetical protein
LRLCPANPGNPRRNIEGESPLQGRTYGLRVQRPWTAISVACGHWHKRMFYKADGRFVRAASRVGWPHMAVRGAYALGRLQGRTARGVMAATAIALQNFLPMSTAEEIAARERERAEVKVTSDFENSSIQSMA